MNRFTIVILGLLALSSSAFADANECKTCQMVYTTAQGVYTLLPNQQQFLEWLKKADFCTYLPAQQQQKCKDFVAGDLTAFVTALENHVSAATFCQQAKLCTTPSLVQEVAVEDDFPYCVLCGAAVSGVEFLANNPFGANITDLLINACNMVPPSFTDECKQKLANSQQIAKAIKDQVAPTKVCAMANLCAGPVSRPFPKISSPLLNLLKKTKLVQKEVERKLRRSN
eukprot:TRINITY_DN542_c0_g1_i1.p1 TRINITY_DN542_c0_g1~~TRINITY_DN542_c0_g1_i1.p1  ORF type:complete len:242 (+),score=77.45 TRINITY_DN542_c0_g1_i1:46-726(+)